MRFLYLTFLILFTVCCNKNQDNCGDVKVTYNNTIKDILEESCNNGDCHVGPNGGWQVLSNFSSYNSLLPYLESGQISSRINTTETSLRMPPPFIEDRQVTDSDLTLLNNWICNGFPEN